MKFAAAGVCTQLGQTASLFGWGFSGEGKESYFYKKLSKNLVKCLICPHGCIIKPGEYGICNTRMNQSGIEINTGYGNPCILEVVPIEMSPLYHFLPSTNAFSLTTGGCNLKCLYCQNWTISQLKPHQTRNMDVSSVEAVKLAEKKQCKSIVFSYGEPVCYMEYADEIAQIARGNDIRINWVTAGYMNKDPLKKISRFIDAYTVTLKAFSDSSYKKLTGIKLKPVLNTISEIQSMGKWLEIVNLIVPTYNDGLKDIRKMCRWIKRNLGADVPLHFGRFQPKYKLTNLPATPKKTVEAARQIGFDEGLNYVYISNISPHDGNNTYCPKCGKTLIKRLGFSVIENNLKGNKCCKCGHKIPGIFR